MTRFPPIIILELEFNDNGSSSLPFDFLLGAVDGANVTYEGTC